MTTSTSAPSTAADPPGSAASRDRHEARIRAGGVEKDVEPIETEAAQDAVDAAYQAKYASRYASIVPSIVAPEAQAGTLKLVPKEDR